MNDCTIKLQKGQDSLAVKVKDLSTDIDLLKSNFSKEIQTNCENTLHKLEQCDLASKVEDQSVKLEHFELSQRKNIQHQSDRTTELEKMQANLVRTVKDLSAGTESFKSDHTQQIIRASSQSSAVIKAAQEDLAIKVKDQLERQSDRTAQLETVQKDMACKVKDMYADIDCLKLDHIEQIRASSQSNAIIKEAQDDLAVKVDDQLDKYKIFEATQIERLQSLSSRTVQQHETVKEIFVSKVEDISTSMNLIKSDYCEKIRANSESNAVLKAAHDSLVKKVNDQSIMLQHLEKASQRDNSELKMTQEVLAHKVEELMSDIRALRGCQIQSTSDLEKIQLEMVSKCSELAAAQRENMAKSKTLGSMMTKLELHQDRQNSEIEKMKIDVGHLNSTVIINEAPISLLDEMHGVEAKIRSDLKAADDILNKE